MATTKAPKGRMTKPITTRYEVGDTVVLTRKQEDDPRAPRVGDVGEIRRIVIADAKDGDGTFLLHFVRWLGLGRTYDVCASEIEAIPRARYEARVVAKHAVQKLRELADAGVDLTAIDAAIDRVSAKAADDEAWLRRQIDGLTK